VSDVLDEKQMKRNYLSIKDMINEIAGLAIMVLKSFPESETKIATFLSELEFTPSEKYKPLLRDQRLPNQYIH
jgi:hypothetical protein